MKWLRNIMATVDDWPTYGGPWWLDSLTSRIIDHAHRLGLVYRLSVSQVEWTERGAELARKYR